MNRTLRTQWFTLLELLVAMAVFSVMMVVLMQFLASTQKVTVSTRKSTAVFSDGRLALELISRDLRSVYHDDTFSLKTGTTPSDISTSLDGVVHNGAGGSCIVFKAFSQNASMVDSADAADQKAAPGTLCQVAYYLDSGGVDQNGDLKIGIRESRYNHDASGTSGTGYGTLTTETLISDVKRLTFTPLLGGGGEYDPAGDGTAAFGQDMLPDAVCIDLTLGEGVNIRSFSRIVYMGRRLQNLRKMASSSN